MILTKQEAQLRRDHILEKIKKAHKKSKLIIVSKGRSLSEISPFLLEKETQHFGENRFREAKEKYLDSELKNKIERKQLRLHYLAAIQSGNARQIPRLFQYVHGLSNWTHLEIFSKTLQNLKKNALQPPLNYFIQLKLSSEKNKTGGFCEKEIRNTNTFPDNEWVRFRGFMTMGVYQDIKQTEEIFHRAKEIRDQIAPNSELSMGMTDDWLLALKYDSDWLRIGSYLFT